MSPKRKEKKLYSLSYFQMRRLVFEQSSPVHPVSDAMGGGGGSPERYKGRSTKGKGQRTKDGNLRVYFWICLYTSFICSLCNLIEEKTKEKNYVLLSQTFF